MATPTPIISKNPLSISLPLTAPTGKIRVKQRDTFSEYGQPVAVKTTKMQNSNYVEWQIGYDLLANEDLTKEKQRAVGVQPMLYVCIPITELEFKKQVIGRPLETKEYGKWNVTLDVAEFSLEVFKMFGMLTENTITMFVKFSKHCLMT